MKPTRRNHLAATTILLVMTALAPVTASATPFDLSSGAIFDAGWSSGLEPNIAGGRNNFDLYSGNGGINLWSGLAGTGQASGDGGIALWGTPLSMVLGVDNSGGKFEIFTYHSYINALPPVFKIDTPSNTATFSGLNVTVNGGSLSVAGNLNLTGGTGTGLSMSGASIFTLDSSGCP